MTKAKAMAISGIMMLALISGVIGYSLRIGAAGATAAKPIVKTVTQTVTVKKQVKPKGGSGAVKTITLPAPSTASSQSGSSHDGGFETESESGDD